MKKSVDACIWVALGMAFLHLLTIALPPINLEFAFSDASYYFENGNKALLDQYFKYQANTIAIPYLGYLLSNISGIEPLYALRLLSTLGLLIIVFAIRKIASFAELKLNIAFYLILMLNPLLWTYAGRATADIFPAAVAILSMSLLLDQRLNYLRSLLAGLVFGFACALKYHSILVLPLAYLMLLVRFDWRTSAKIIFVFASTAILVLSIFVYEIYRSYGFFFTPPAYQKIHGFGLVSPINNLLGYIGYLFLLAFPFSLLADSFFKKLKPLAYYAKVLLLSVLSFAIGFAFISNTGELDLGPLNRWVSPQLSSGFLAVFVFIGVFSLVEQISNEGRKRNKILIAIGLAAFVLILSFTRPAQRYLIFVIPFLLLVLNQNNYRKKYIVAPAVGILLLINIFVAYSQWSTGLASRLMVDHLLSVGLINETDPGDIEGHVGNYFNESTAKTRMYKVVAGRLPSSVYISDSPYKFGQKSYSLVRVR